MYRFADLYKISFDVGCEPFVFRIGCYECIRTGTNLVEHPSGHPATGDCEMAGAHVWFVQACLLRVDTYQKTETWGFGGKIPVSPYMAHGEIVKKFLVAALAYGEHEVREAFEYRGRRIFGPHIDVDALWDIAEHTETRDNADS